MEHMILPVAVALLFFAIIPGLGAFSARAKWRWFRKSIIRASLYPEVSYASLCRRDGEMLGTYRIIGSLQAIQGENTVWVRNERVSVAAELSGVDVYVLPVPERPESEDRIEHFDVTMPELMPRRIPWNSIFSMPEGTEMLISGTLYVENGTGVFRSSSDASLIVVVFEGEARTIVQRSIWIGRHRNEYWNKFTPMSVAAGSLALLLIASSFFKTPLFRLYGILTITMCLVPVIPFLPPGVAFYFSYKWMWRRGRMLRAERDLFKLPLRYFGDGDSPDTEVPMPNGGFYAMRRYPTCTDAKEATGGKGLVRTSILLKPERLAAEECWVFGVLRDGIIDIPDDPLSELVYIPGNPEELTNFCSRKARIFEILSGCSYILGFVLNAVLLLMIISMLIR